MSDRRALFRSCTLAVAAASCLGLGLVLAPGGATAAASTFINYDDFSAPTGLSYVSDAVATDNVVRLTPADNGRGGAVWSNSTLDPTQDFSTDFAINLHDSTSCPADGVDFVVQNSPDGNGAIGDFGGDMGYRNITNSFAAEFDDFPYNGGDPRAEHVGFLTGGDTDNADFPSDFSSTNVPELYGNGTIYSWLDYTAATNEMALYVSSSNTKPATPTLDAAVDLGAAVGAGDAYVGFTAGTGACNQVQDVQSWHLSGTAGQAANDGLTLTANPPSPSTTAQPTFTASVARNDGSTDTPAGTVDFSVDGGQPVSEPLNSTGAASFTPTVPLDQGTHRVSARYSGDGSADPATNYVRYVVTAPQSRIQILPPSGTSVDYGMPIAAAVGPRKAPRPQGTVKWYDLDDGTFIAETNLVNGKARLAPNALPAGDHSIEADFISSNSTYGNAYVESLVSIAQASTSTTLVSTKNPAPSTINKYLVATVKPEHAGTKATGTVTFFDNGNAVATEPVDSRGIARLPIRGMSTGTHPITATYNGDNNFTESTSNEVDQQIT